MNIRVVQLAKHNFITKFTTICLLSEQLLAIIVYHFTRRNYIMAPIRRSLQLHYIIR